jgi:hypothetical protein
VILNPDPGAHKASVQQASDQLAASVSQALASGLALGLARELQKLTLSDGPWLLHADGSVTEPDAQQ